MEKEWTMIIRPQEKLWKVNLKEIWDYRDLIELFVRRNIVTVYKQTLLGSMWYIIQPILTVIMNMVVFGGIAKLSTDGVPQALFYLAGNVCWFYFSDCLNQTSSTFLANQGIFGKVYFPRMVVPISTVISNLLRFGVQLLLYAAVYLYFLYQGSELCFGVVPLPADVSVIVNALLVLIILLVLVVLIAGLGLGFGILISSMTTKYRDMTILLGFFVSLWMYATPIVYPISMVTNETLRTIIMLNPMTSIIEAFKFLTIGHGYFSWLALCYSFIFMIVSLLLGMVIFNKVQRSFMDTV